jgi:hypothetical protein
MRTGLALGYFEPAALCTKISVDRRTWWLMLQ